MFDFLLGWFLGSTTSRNQDSDDAASLAERASPPPSERTPVTPRQATAAVLSAAFFLVSFGVMLSFFAGAYWQVDKEAGAASAHMLKTVLFMMDTVAVLLGVGVAFVAPFLLYKTALDVMAATINAKLDFPGTVKPAKSRAAVYAAAFYLPWLLFVGYACSP